VGIFPPVIPVPRAGLRAQIVGIEEQTGGRDPGLGEFGELFRPTLPQKTGGGGGGGGQKGAKKKGGFFSHERDTLRWSRGKKPKRGHLGKKGFSGAVGGKPFNLVFFMRGGAPGGGGRFFSFAPAGPRVLQVFPEAKFSLVWGGGGGPCGEKQKLPPPRGRAGARAVSPSFLPGW